MHIIIFLNTPIVSKNRVMGCQRDSSTNRDVLVHQGKFRVITWTGDKQRLHKQIISQFVDDTVGYNLSKK